MQFDLFGKKIEISEKTVELNRVVCYFEDLKKQACKDIKKEYGGFDCFFDGVFSDEDVRRHKVYEKIDYYSRGNGGFGDSFIRGYIENIGTLLAEYGIYTISEAEIYHKTFGNESTSLAQELSSFFYCLQHDSRDATWKLGRISEGFNNGGFNSAICYDIARMADVVLFTLENNGSIECDSLRNLDKAMAIYTNLCNGAIPEDKKRELIVEMMVLHPIKFEFYEYIFENFHEVRYEIVKMARVFSYDMNKHLEDKLNSQYDISKFDTEEKALEARKELDAELALYEITGCSISDELDKLIKKYDEEARTFKGILYDNRDIRALAEKQDAEIMEMCTDIFLSDRDVCVDIREKLKAKGYIESVVNPYMNSVNERINQLEKSHLDELCAGVESLLETECHELLKKIHSLGYDDGNTALFIKKVNDRIKSIWDKEDYDKFSVMYLETDPADEAKKSKYISIVENEGRTPLKLRFIDAFSKLTIDNIVTAAKYANATEKGGIAKITRLGKGQIYKTLTVDDTLKHPAMVKEMEQIKRDEAEHGGFWGNIFSVKK